MILVHDVFKARAGFRQPWSQIVSFLTECFLFERLGKNRQRFSLMRNLNINVFLFYFVEISWNKVSVYL